MKSFTRHLLIASLITICLSIFHLVFARNGHPLTVKYVLMTFGYNALFTYPFYLFNSYAHSFARNYQEKSNLKPHIFWIIYLVFIVISNVLTALILINLKSLISDGEFIFDKSHFYGVIIISFIIGIFFYALFYINAIFNKKTKEQEKTINNVTQNHEALKSQIGPHFLFNSLNVLSGLVDENPDKAQDFIADLAQVYRYVLDQKDKDWVTVSEEIDFAENYLELIKTRFENGLNINIQEDLNNSELKIVPLTLQLLLENCIKHNAVSKEKPLQIEIYTKQNNLIVKNNLNPKRQLIEREGTGLKNIQKRYNIIEKEVSITKTKTDFMVSIPLTSMIK